MSKIIKLTESDLSRIVRRVINEQNFNYNALRLCKPGDNGKLVLQGNLFALSNGTPFCKVISTSAKSTSATVHATPKPTQSGGGQMSGPSQTGQGAYPRPAQRGPSGPPRPN